jgi:hypothetical protein
LDDGPHTADLLVLPPGFGNVVIGKQEPVRGEKSSAKGQPELRAATIEFQG